MTTMINAPGPVTSVVKPGLRRLFRSERLKLSSTKTWWLFGIGVVVSTIATMFINIGITYSDIFDPNRGTGDGDTTAATTTTATPPPPATTHQIATHAADVFTSGQYFGALFVMLLAILMITNEYYHQTATTTYLATPHRTTVVASKFIIAMFIAVAVWVVTTVIDLIGGSIFFHLNSVSSQLGSWVVERSIIVNLLMFALWAVFGIGLGALMRSQIGATVTATLLYTLGLIAVQIVFAVIHQFIYKHDSVYQLMVLVPAFAAQVADSASRIDLPGGTHGPQWWVGVLVMLAYGAITATIGTLILRKRDIS